VRERGRGPYGQCGQCSSCHWSELLTQSPRPHEHRRCPSPPCAAEKAAKLPAGHRY
jgi:hypothetical protein